jgi:hypothetical protein
LIFIPIPFASINSSGMVDIEHFERRALATTPLVAALSVVKPIAVENAPEEQIVWA